MSILSNDQFRQVLPKVELQTKQEPADVPPTASEGPCKVYMAVKYKEPRQPLPVCGKHTRSTTLRLQLAAHPLPGSVVWTVGECLGALKTRHSNIFNVTLPQGCLDRVKVTLPQGCLHRVKVTLPPGCLHRVKGNLTLHNNTAVE